MVQVNGQNSWLKWQCCQVFWTKYVHSMFLHKTKQNKKNDPRSKIFHSPQICLYMCRKLPICTHVVTALSRICGSCRFCIYVTSHRKLVCCTYCSLQARQLTASNIHLITPSNHGISLVPRPLPWYIQRIPHVMGRPDHVPSLWQTLSMAVVFNSHPLSSSQTKQAVEPGVVPLQ